MSATDRPSLTPHRDQVQRIHASHVAAGPAIGWQGQLFLEASLAVHLVIADARDRGVDGKDLALIAPKLLYIVAAQLCGAFGHDSAAASILLKAAQSPDARIELTRKTVEKLVKGAAPGGRA